MEQIKILDILKKQNTLTYHFRVSTGLEKYFSDRDFVIEYPESVEMVSDGIAVIPFVCNVLPIIWLTNSTLIIPELDEAFFNCIPEVKKGYMKMYPESAFLGEIKVKRIVPCDRPAEPGKCAMFYSGGADSVQTLISHMEEKPTLLSIWGSDIKYSNSEGWKALYKALKEASDHYDLKLVTIHSSFREFDRERELGKDFSGKLKDGWWHGVKHGIALLGHVAPYAYLHSLEKMYIASSHCPEDGHVRCASNPLIDNNVRYANCQVIHDGFEYGRQNKIHNIVHYAIEKNDYPFLHVCWETQTGENCCKCEKCYRTIVAIIAEGGDPERFGFEKYKEKMGGLQKTVLNNLSENLAKHWKKIQKALQENKRIVKYSPCWESIKWILKADFDHPETIKIPIPISSGIRPWLSQFTFYQRLHDMKEKFK